MIVCRIIIPFIGSAASIAVHIFHIYAEQSVIDRIGVFVDEQPRIDRCRYCNVRLLPEDPPVFTRAVLIHDLFLAGNFRNLATPHLAVHGHATHPRSQAAVVNIARALVYLDGLVAIRTEKSIGQKCGVIILWGRGQSDIPTQNIIDPTDDTRAHRHVVGVHDELIAVITGVQDPGIR